MQQLFLTNLKQKSNKLFVDDAKIIFQLKKVVRLKQGDIFFVQEYLDNKIIRYKCVISDRDNNNIYVNISSQEEKKYGDKNYSMLIGMPNKRQKIELIVQKLTEIGINNIFFLPMKRSVIKTYNKNKFERLNKIKNEAIEQSFSWTKTNIKFVENLEILNNMDFVVFDKIGDFKEKTTGKICNICGIVGPEGGLTDEDLSIVSNIKKKINLGKNTYRCETASIIGAWYLKNIL